MRIYIIGNDGITLCREPPATIDKGEIALSSKEELHASRLSGKRLVALWNALPGVEKQTKFGDRGALTDRLWTCPSRTRSQMRSARQNRVLSWQCRSGPRAQSSMKSRARRAGSGTRFAVSFREP